MPAPVTGTLARLPKAVVAGVAGAVVLAGGAVAAIQLTSGNESDQLADASKVLQSVDVGVGQSGRLTSIKGTTVGTTTSGKQFSVDKTYEPGKVADQLPVRVLTSYKTAKGTGTDLSDLEGYDGRVDITLTVQNLTQKAKNLTFDVGGTQQTRSALVGVPLTVVGSTSLPDTKPSQVVGQSDAGGTTPAASKTGTSTAANAAGGTNGVLSQGSDGKTQVQWATLLAPPQLGASTALNLSVDAKNFKVPDFDLSVQPGLVTDPSIGALLNESFAPESGSQLALTRRTIDLISKVNGVLGQAGQSMSRVRTTLNDSSDKLGTETVADLKSSTENIASSVKGLQGSSQQLGQDLSGALKSTQSTTLAELQATNQSIDKLLGDTNAPAPRPIIKQGADQCSATVERPRGATSIYGNLQEVAALLEGYSTATRGCSQVLRDRILNAVGPDNAEACTDTANPDDNESATCSLFSARDRVVALAAQLGTNEKQALDAFREGIEGLDAAVNGMYAEESPEQNYTRLHETQCAAQDPTKYHNGLTYFVAQLQLCSSAVGSFSLEAASRNKDNPPPALDTTDLQAAADKAKAALQTLQGTLTTSAQQGLDSVDAAQSTTNDLSNQICTEATNLAASNPAAAEAIAKLRKYTDNQQCFVGGSVDDSYNDSNLSTQLQRQGQAWKDIQGSLSNGPASNDFNALSGAIDDVTGQAASLKSQADQISKSYNVEQIATNYNKLRTFQKALEEQVQRVTDKTATAVDTGSNQSTFIRIKTAFDEAYTTATKTTDDIAGPNGEKVVQISQSGQQSAADVDKLFNSSLGNLSASAQQIVTEGKKTIVSQKQTFGVRQKQSADAISGSISKGLSQVNAGVTSSTKDLGAAKTLLQGDINNVLLDLGQRDVKGSGLLGAIARGAATTGTANFQLAQAVTTASSYANVRQGDVAAILLGQAQAQAGQEAQAALPAFALSLPDSTRHTTVYSLHVTS